MKTQVVILTFLYFVHGYQTTGLEEEVVSKSTVPEQNGDRQKPFNILMLSLPGAGHLMPLLALGEELVLRGHHVTLCTGQLSETNEQKVVKMATKAGVAYLSNGRESGYWQQTVNYKAISGIKGIKMLSPLINEIGGMLSFWFEKLAKEPAEKENWDFILFDDILMPAAMCIHSQDKIPAVLVGTTSQMFVHLSPPWPWPHIKAGNTSDNLSFFHRLRSELTKLLAPLSMRFIFVGSQRSISNHYCPNATMTYLTTGPGIVVPYLVPTVIGFEYARMITPLSHYVGPLLTKRPDPLPNDLKQWLDNKQDMSVVYISMGSVLGISAGMGRAFVEGVNRTYHSAVFALSKTNSKVLEGLNVDTERMFVIEWAPQLSILQHKAISMAIVHGGFNGIHESLYNGVPLIVVPLFADQFGNAGRVVHQGLGLSLDASTITAEKITSSINEIDSGDYRRNVERLQKIFISAGGVEKAADLVEYYKDIGFDHLIPAYAKYEWSWVQYYNVDVYGLLAVILVIVIYCSLKCCQCVWRRACLKRKQKRD